MCGISGILTKKRNITDAQDVISESSYKLEHRGPDQDGLFFEQVGNFVVSLAHRRLSIIDLSEDGKQPFTSDDGRYVLSYNGEIYNYLELRQELEILGHKFRTNTDTEVVLRSWIEWQESSIPKLKGMFAFVIIDLQSARGFLIRDAFGIKPLFYKVGEEELLFSSELPSLLSLFPKDKKFSFNAQTIVNYLLYGEYDGGNSCFIDEICCLEPGQLAEFNFSDKLTFKTRKWWNLSISHESKLSETQAADILQKLISENIKIHLRSDVPIAVSLSGGIDSSALVYAIREQFPELTINTFSFISDRKEQSEENWVDKVNLDVGANGHKLHLSTQAFLKDVDSFIISQGEPVGGTSVFAQYKISQLMKKKGFTVALEGQGADEVFGGYYGYPGQRIRSYIDHGKYFKALKFLNNWANWPGRSITLGVKYFLAEILPDQIYACSRKIFANRVSQKWLHPDLLESKQIKIMRERHSKNQPDAAKTRRLKYQLRFQICKRGLPSLLRHSDRNSMAHSIESRVPFLTTDIAEFMMSLDEKLLVSPKGETKYLFRKALEKFMPHEIVYRKDKIGYETPEGKWGLALIPRLKDKLKREGFVNPYLNTSALIDMLDEHERKQKVCSSDFIWRIYNFIVWYDHFQAKNNCDR